MGTKTDEQLDGMVSHVYYEAASLIGFLGAGNERVVDQVERSPEMALFAARSVLEAALLNARCVDESLRRHDHPRDRITARD
jgi:hypothetical protein